MGPMDLDHQSDVTSQDVGSGATQDQTVEGTAGAGNLRWLWILVLIALVAIVGVVLWLMLSGGEEESTIGFDGTTATYVGPVDMSSGTVSFTLDNTHTNAVDFARFTSTDSRLMAADAEAWREANPTADPPWIGRWHTIGVGMPDQLAVYDVTLEEGVYEIVAFDRFTGIVYSAGVIRVTDG